MLKLVKFDQTSHTTTTSDLETVFGSMSDELWVRFGFILAPKTDQTSILKFDCFLDAFWEGSGAALSN